MSKRRILTVLLTASAVWLPAALRADDGETVRPVFSAYTLEAGSAHIADTYLTPLKYNGQHFGIDYQRWQAMKFDPQRWVMQLDMRLTLNHTVNPAGNATMWDAMLEFRWGMMRRWRLPQGFSAGIGGSASINGGALYLGRNGNNPVSAKAAFTVNATGYAAWNGTVLGRPLTLRYQPVLPVAGVFFSPDYGELYYEIYLGNHSGLAHFAWWGNYFMLDNHLTADLSLGATSLRLGYSGRIFSSKVNDIVTHVFTHAFVVGISGEWMSLNPRKGISADARIISATY